MFPVPSPIKLTWKMFPHNITLEETLQAIKGMDEFKVFPTKQGYSFIKYLRCDNSTFPDISTAKNDQEKRMLQIRRECRGVTFDSNTGKCVARRFHKFFNVNEKQETNQEKIDFSRPFSLVEKLDGSLVSPLLVDDKLLFCSMSGFTDFTLKISDYLDQSKIKYTEFCIDILGKGYTPLFEWCDSSVPIVIRHEKDGLILLSIRNISTGEYMKLDDIERLATKYGVPMTMIWRDFPKDDPVKLLDAIYEKRGTEGFVIVFEDGDMYKAKTNYYSCAHGISPNSKFLNDRMLLKAICQNVIDDVISILPFSLSKREVIQLWRDTAQQSIRDKIQVLENGVASSEFDKRLLEFSVKCKSQDGHGSIVTAFVLEIATDYTIYREHRKEILTWLGVEQIKEETKEVIVKKDKWARENDKDIFIDEDDLEEEIFEEEEEVSLERVKQHPVLMCSIHKIPIEYCEFQVYWEKCKDFLKENDPELLERIMKAKESDPIRKPVEKKKKKSEK